MASIAKDCSPKCIPADPTAPRELAMVSHPGYIIETPDVLLIDAIRMVPKPPYRIAPLDSIVVQVTDIPPEEPINGLFVVEADGTVYLGYSYGSVEVSGRTLQEAKVAIEGILKSAQAQGSARARFHGPDQCSPTDSRRTLGTSGRHRLAGKVWRRSCLWNAS